MAPIYRPAPMAVLVACYLATVIDMVCVQGPGWPDHLCWVIAASALRLNSRAGTEGSMVFCLNCDRWLILGLVALDY